MTQQISHVTCSCFDCVFKEIDINPKLQTGCKLGKIDSFIKNGARVEFVEKTLSFEINRYCKWFRDQGWSEEHNNSDLINIVNKETEFRWSAIIQLSNINRLKQAIENILAEPIQPIEIIIITQESILSVISICNSQMKNTPWSIEQPINEQSIDRCIQSRYYRDNLGKCSHYVWTLDDLEIYSGFTKDINAIINEDMVPLMAILPKSGNHGAIINKCLHALFYMESNSDSIIQKIDAMFEDKEIRNKHIMSWERAMTTRWT